MEELDMEEINQEEVLVVEGKQKTPKKQVINKGPKGKEISDSNHLINCLRNERVIVRFVPREGGLVRPGDTKHIYYGGMAEGASVMLTVPMLKSGDFVNVLTKDEKAYLEEIMGLEYNALSIYRKQDNYWDNLTVTLYKSDTYFDLSSPEDYIRYKVVLSNKDIVAPSLAALRDNPKVTYRYVVIEEGEEYRQIAKGVDATMQAYMKFGEIQDNFDILRAIVETMEGRPISPNTKLEFLKTKINGLIQANVSLFLATVEDKLLQVKILIRKCVDKGIISKRGEMFYLRRDNTPLCLNGEDPTLSQAAKFLSLPVNQELKFSLEAELKV